MNLYYKDTIKSFLRTINHTVSFKDSHENYSTLNCIFKLWHSNLDRRHSAKVTYSNPVSYHCFTCGASGSLEYVIKKYMWEMDPNFGHILSRLQDLQKEFPPDVVKKRSVFDEEIVYDDHTFFFNQLPYINSFWQKFLYNKGVHDYNIFRFVRQLGEDLLIPFFKDQKCIGYRVRYKNPAVSERKYAALFGFKLRNSFYLDWIYKTPQDFLILVEGEIDALHLLQFQVPVLSFSGASNWSRYRRDYLFEKFLPKGIMIIPDEDGPGLKGAEVIRKSLSKYARVNIARFYKDPKQITRREIYDKFERFKQSCR